MMVVVKYLTIIVAEIDLQPRGANEDVLGDVTESTFLAKVPCASSRCCMSDLLKSSNSKSYVICGTVTDQ